MRGSQNGCAQRKKISTTSTTYSAHSPRCRPNQLFMPHINMLDYVPWPAFRELAVQIPAMQERMEWLMDMSNTLRCDWSLPTGDPIHRVEETGLTDLRPSARVCHLYRYLCESIASHRDLRDLITDPPVIARSTMLTICRTPCGIYQTGLSGPRLEVM